MGYNLEKLRFVFEIIAFRFKMRKHFVLRIISAGGFVTFDVSLVPGEYTIAAKPTKNETVKVMVDGKEVSTFTVKKKAM